MKFQVLEVTPQMAEGWLALNVANRHVRKGYVKQLAEAMKRGEWAVTHQPIAINGDRLLDGQHRLMALMQSGLLSLKMSVVQDAETSTFDAIDIGARRKDGDIYREDLHVMHPISFIGRLLNSPGLTPRALRNIYERFALDIRELVALYHRGTKTFTAAPIKVGAVAAMLNGEEKAYVHKVFSDLCSYNIAELPKVGQVFVRQMTIDSQGGRKVQSTERQQLLIRSFIVFQKQNADLARVLVRDESGRMNEIRGLFRDALGIKEA